MVEILTLPTTIMPHQIKTGMTIRLHQKIKETSPSGEEKERIQLYEGLVIHVHGSVPGRTMTIRKISHSIGVEKIFPLGLPSITKVELIKAYKVRRKNIKFVRNSKKRMKEIKKVKV